LAAGVKLRQSFGKIWRRLMRRPDPVSASDLALRVATAADWLQLAPLLDRRVQTLSGGEEQRLVLGRAVVSQHPLWLLDEPLEHLDPAVRQSIRAELLLLRERLGPTMIEVSHDPVDALQRGHRVAVVSEGRIEQVGPPAEVYARPASRCVATSLGWPPMNFIEGTRAAPGGDGEILGVRAEDLALGSGGIDLGLWRIERVDPLGIAGLWTVKRDGQRLQRWARPGEMTTEMVRLSVARERCHRFDAKTGRRIERS
jgi:ABC-type sugar transport system ATPase subunit